MTDLRQASQQALDALEQLDGLDTETESVTIDVGDVIAALHTALAQPPLPEQEHITHITWDERGVRTVNGIPDDAPQQQQAEPPPEWPLIKNILAVFGLDAIAFVAEWKAAQQQAEPVAYFDFQQHKFSWAEHMQIGPVPVSIKVEPVKLYLEAPQRPWVGLEIEEVQDSYNSDYQAQTRAVEKLLKERNK